MPGHFPYAAGVFELKRKGEDPTRMFAGEGTPERTNKRFHYVSSDSDAKRLSTAFDSVTLYGEDPHERPDIYGKIGNSGVSVCTIDDARKLYSGFDLCSPSTSVSMTINGPAPMVLGFFFNAAVDQQVERHLRETGGLEAAQQAITEAWRAKALELPKEHYSISFQSRLGRTPWLKPYTDQVVVELAQKNKKRLAVFCPSFVADCLETLEEIGIRARDSFRRAGGEALERIPALNAHPRWVDTVCQLIRDS